MPRAIVLVVIDCLRADHVSGCGYVRETTPTLDELAAGGVLWEQAYSVSSWTKPAVLSMLTGLYPSQHGAFEGVKRDRREGLLTTDALPADVPTLAERLTRAGWCCGAFINNAQLGEFTGLNRGFECYLPAVGKADPLLAAFADWLRQNGSRPIFAYLHFLEAHWPYKPRRRHVALFGGDRDTNYFRDFSARDYGRLRRGISRGEATLREDLLEQMVQMYDGAVRRLDGKLRELLSLLEEAGLRDDTALFVTADHGEEFLDHGKIGHGQSLHEELVHVPLVACIPGGPAGVRVREPVSLVDLAGTLLHVAGAADANAQPSVLPGGQRRAVVSELRIKRRYTQALRAGRWKLHRRFNVHDGGRGDLRRPAFELGRSGTYQTELQLYDLVDDPHEQVNLAGAALARPDCERLCGELDSWWEMMMRSGSPGGREVAIDAQVVARLRALGYVD